MMMYSQPAAAPAPHWTFSFLCLHHLEASEALREGFGFSHSAHLCNAAGSLSRMAAAPGAAGVRVVGHHVVALLPHPM